MENFSIQNADRILVSNTQGGRVIERKGYRKLLDVLPSPVNLERFTYKEPHFQGGFSPWDTRTAGEREGAGYAALAISDLHDDVRLRIVGDGPARFRLEKMARELGVYERTAFASPLSHEEMRNFIMNAMQWCFPRKPKKTGRNNSGGCGGSDACGTPVIGSDCGAIPEVIGEAGLIFSEGKAKDLADKIQMLHRDIRLQRELSFRGRVRVEQEFSAERAARKLDQHLRELYDRRERPGIKRHARGLECALHHEPQRNRALCVGIDRWFIAAERAGFISIGFDPRRFSVTAKLA
jgi:glycosyltransferase involved in cell wall biosynthesis